MATIYLTLSTKVDATKKQEILLRFSHGKINQRAKSNIFTFAEYWDCENEKIKIPNFRLQDEEKKELTKFLTTQQNKLQHLTKWVAENFNETDKKNLSPEWLKDCVDKFYKRGKYVAMTEKTAPIQSIYDVSEEFLAKQRLTELRKNDYRFLIRLFKKYEAINQTKNENFVLELDTFTPETLQDFSNFLRNEHEIYKQYPKIYEQSDDFRKPQPRSQNTINNIINMVRAFILWSKKNKYTTNNPFENFSVEESVYGTPFYITIEERNKIYKTDFSKFPELEKDKDIFVFQCLIGCRVADLYRFTKDNIINGAVHYIASKTRDGRPVTVQVPLNSIAKEILSKYDKPESNEILPFGKKDYYNDNIKEIFKIAGITRNVVLLDPLTRTQVIRPINEVASSHIARRCFCGNLYKQVKDPNLVSSLSGHSEGSRAFARYRDIDTEMKQELVKMLE